MVDRLEPFRDGSPVVRRDLFNGATFADLERGNGPFIITTATDISTGARLPFDQDTFDILCSDLRAIPLSRAAAASSAVPLVLSPVTINNYGGTCNYTIPPWLQPFTDPAKRTRPAARALRDLQGVLSYEDGVHRPYIHLVDGGVSDNLGMRGVLDSLEIVEALRAAHQPTPFDQVRRVIVFVVNSLSSPRTGWDESERAPGNLTILRKATGVPIDHYSYEATELLKDVAARWQTMRRLRDRPRLPAVRTLRWRTYSMCQTPKSIPSMCRSRSSRTRPSSPI